MYLAWAQCISVRVCVGGAGRIADARSGCVRADSYTCDAHTLDPEQHKTADDRQTRARAHASANEMAMAHGLRI